MQNLCEEPEPCPTSYHQLPPPTQHQENSYHNLNFYTVTPLHRIYFSPSSPCSQLRFKRGDRLRLTVTSPSGPRWHWSAENLSALISGNTVRMCFCGSISHQLHTVIIYFLWTPSAIYYTQAAWSWITEAFLPKPPTETCCFNVISGTFNWLQLQGSEAVDSSRSSLVPRSVSRLRAGHVEGVHRHALNSNEPLVGFAVVQGWNKIFRVVVLTGFTGVLSR